MAQLFTNNGVSTLASGISNSATSLSVQTGDGAKYPSPSGGDFALITLANAGAIETVFEEVKLTGRSGDTLTIVRAQEGSTAVAWSAGDKVELRITKGFLNQVGDQVSALGNVSGATSVDLTAGNAVTATATGAVTWSVSNPGVRCGFFLRLTNGGAYTQTWMSGIKWASGTAPALTASGVDVLAFFTTDGGTTWDGVLVSKDTR